MGSLLVTAPTLEPVTLEELQSHLRVDDDDGGALALKYLKPAREYVESYLRRVLVTQTWDLKIGSDWPQVAGDQVIDLPLQPVQSVTSITYVDANGATQTLSASLYALRNSGAENLARIEPTYGSEWPSVRDQADAITVRYVAGYGAPSAVPESIKLAILLHVELLYDRNATARDLLESARDSLLMPYRVVRL